MGPIHGHGGFGAGRRKEHWVGVPGAIGSERVVKAIDERRVTLETP